MTVGTAGNADAQVLYARMASVTGAIARGFLDRTTATTSRPTASVAAAPVATTETVATRTATRLSGVGLRLGGTSLLGTSDDTSNDLFADLRSALAGFRAHAGFDQLLVTQLIAAG